MSTVELNLDGLPGPTHHFGGLARGNLASRQHRGQAAHPRRAARQSLAKMRMLYDLGLPQAVFPPHQRPALEELRRQGYSGTDRAILQEAARRDPELLSTCYSAAGMWMANAATVSPAADTPDRRVHFTPANLITNPHRAMETAFTAEMLRRIFPPGDHFVHHPPLPTDPAHADEGAANHTRLCPHYGEAGIELFVFGCSGKSSETGGRQSREASRAVAEHHGLQTNRTLILEQHPEALAQGVFHNDVIAMGNRNLYCYHEQAYTLPDVNARIQQAFTETTGAPALLIPVTAHQLTLEEAVDTYLFNSQLVSPRPDEQVLFAPAGCREQARTRDLIEAWLSEKWIDQVHYVELEESLKNGGGPACLRLRVELPEAALEIMHPGVLFTPTLEERLVHWVEQHYREELNLEELADPLLAEESCRALEELTTLLHLGPVYPFQQ